MSSRSLARASAGALRRQTPGRRAERGPLQVVTSGDVIVDQLRCRDVGDARLGGVSIRGSTSAPGHPQDFLPRSWYPAARLGGYRRPVPMTAGGLIRGRPLSLGAPSGVTRRSVTGGGNTVTSYYTAGADNPAGCSSSAWTGLVCTSGPAAQALAGWATYLYRPTHSRVAMK